MVKKLLTGLAAVGAGWTAAKAARRRQRRIDLTGRVVLVTGGSRGLGLALARQFAEEGARLALLARSEADLQRAAEALRRRGAEALPVRADVRDAAEVARAVEKTVEHYGRLDAAVNNAGVIQVGPLAAMTRADYEEAMQTHFWGAFNVIEAALPHLEAPASTGRLVNVASVGGLVAVPHLAPYSASKFALVGYSDALRAELAARGVRVTTVTPGLMRTGSHRNAFFRGQHEKEYAWFSLSNAFPLLSMDVDRAAGKIVRACARGDAALTLTLPANVLALGSRLAPRLFASGMALAARLLPAAASSENASENASEGGRRQRGWESDSAKAPDALTAPADRAAPRQNERRQPPDPHGNA